MSKSSQRSTSFFSYGKKTRAIANKKAKNPVVCKPGERGAFLNQYLKISKHFIPKQYRGSFYAGWCSAAKMGVL
jgi:hypothetical protein